MALADSNAVEGVAGATFHGACLVYVPQPPSAGPSFLADVSVTLDEGETKVIYEKNGATYSIAYKVLGKGDAKYELRQIELTLAVPSKDMAMSASGEAGTMWRQGVELKPPFGLATFGCNAL
jgi:ABC-type hemin transport system ATPase subunit